MKILVLIFSLFSRLGSSIKNVLYELRVFKPKPAPLPVISVGNIALGGTEKTPLAMELLARLLQEGRRPALVARGYKGRWERHGGILSDGKKILGTWQDGGDEPYLAAKKIPQAGVYVGKDRLASCLRAKEQGFDIVVLDDGFQHRRLRRDLDIVLYSPQEKTALREPTSSLARADVLLIKEGQAGEAEQPPGLRRSPRNIFSYKVAGAGLLALWTGEVLADEALAGKRVVAFCGIARPERFLGQLRRTGAALALSLAFPDHHPYPRSSLEKIIRACRETTAEAAVTTEKDAVKILAGQALFGSLPVYALRIRIQADPGFSELLCSFLKRGRLV